MTRPVTVRLLYWAQALCRAVLLPFALADANVKIRHLNCVDRPLARRIKAYGFLYSDFTFDSLNPDDATDFATSHDVGHEQGAVLLSFFGFPVAFPGLTATCPQSLLLILACRMTACTSQTTVKKGRNMSRSWVAMPSPVTKL